MTFDPAHQGSGLATEALTDRNAAVHCEARLVEADWFKEEWTTVRVYAALRRDWEGGGSR